MIRCLLFDLGETLTEIMIDDLRPLDELPLVAFSDAIPTLERLRRDRYRLAVVSNTCQSGDAVVSRAIEKVGLRCYFDTVVTSVDVGHEKPAPEVFLEALSRVGCDTNESVMVGDNPINDIEGAGRLGMRTILVQREAPRIFSSKVQPSFTIGSLNEIPDIVRRWQYLHGR